MFKSGPKKLLSHVLMVGFALFAMNMSVCAQRFSWMSNLQAAEEKSQAQQKPMLTVFR